MGGGNPVKMITKVLANVATGGLYGVAEGAKKAVIDRKPLAGAADALASYGLGGSVLQPTIGTKNTLAIEAAVAGGAVGAAGGIGGGGFGAAGAGGSSVAGPTLGVASGIAGTGAGTVAAGAPAAGGGLAGASLGATAAGGAVKAADKLIPPKVPDLPALDLAAEEEKARKAAEEAKLAVQSKESEARRSRKARETSSILSSYGNLGSSPSYTPTLQAAKPRRSVLG